MSYRGRLNTFGRLIVVHAQSRIGVLALLPELVGDTGLINTNIAYQGR